MIEKLIDIILTDEYLYCRNSLEKLGHEERIEFILKDVGFEEKFNKESSKKLKKRKEAITQFIIEEHSNNDSKGFYIRHPFGTQNSPDFILIYNNFVQELECKSSLKDNIKWNSGYPKENCLYVISSVELKTTTICFGKDFTNASQKEEIENSFERIRDFVKEENKTLSGDFSFYPRKDFIFSGVSPFKHKDREERETHVRNYWNSCLGLGENTTTFKQKEKSIEEWF